jgi:hypothetical protein
LRAAFDAIAGLEKDAVESIEERVEYTDAEDDALAIRRPLRAENVSRRIAEDDLKTCHFRRSRSAMPAPLASPRPGRRTRSDRPTD